MKIKPIVSLLFLSNFSIYILCPLLMQGNCGFSFLDATSIGKTLSCSNCSHHCNKEAEDTPKEKKYQVEIGNCCFIGLELTRPNEVDALDLSKLFSTTFSLAVVLPSPSTLFPSHEIARKPRPFLNLYDYFPVYQASPRAPPHSPLHFSHI